MLVLIRICIASQCILNLQEVRLIHVYAPSGKSLSVLLFVSLTNNEVDMMQTEGSIVSQRVLDQGIGVFAMSLCQTLILLSQIYTVTLYPCRNPCLVVTAGSAVREVDLIGKIVVLRLDAKHIEQIDIS